MSCAPKDDRWLRIGLTQRVDAVPGRDEIRDGLDQAWSEVLFELGMLPLAVSNSVPEGTDLTGYFDALEFDGVILTGGNDIAGVPGATNVAPARDRVETALIQYCTEHDLPLLGVCRGYQMLICHHGGTLESVDGHVATSHALRSVGETLAEFDGAIVNSYHGYGIRTEAVPPCFEVMACTDDGFVEAVSHRDHRQWGFMWHPERGPHWETLRIMDDFFRKETA